MKRVLTFAAVLMFASMFTVSKAEAHHSNSGSSHHCSNGHCHSGSSHHGSGGHGKPDNGKCGSGKNGGGFVNTIHPIINKNPTSPPTGTIHPIIGGKQVGNLSGLFGTVTPSTGKGSGSTTGRPGGRPPVNVNQQIPTLGTGFGGFAGAVGQDVGKGVTGVLNAGGAVVGGVANGVGAALGGVANGVGDVLGGVGSAIGDIF